MTALSRVDHVHVLVLGEAQVGKSSLISTLVSRHFSKDVPAVMHDVQIPREESEQNILTTIMDSSSSPLDRPALEERIRHEADVIILVYAADNPYTLERVAAYWLPLIQQARQGVRGTSSRSIGGAAGRRVSGSWSPWR